MGEALWQTRLRWRLRGAMLWPAFMAAVVIEAVLLDRLPVSGADGPGLFAALLLAGFANLFVVAVAAPLAGRWLRRRRPGMTPVIATDRAGEVLVAAGGALRGVRGRGGRRRRRGPGPRAPPELPGRARRPRRPGGRGTAVLRQPGAARVPGQRRPPQHHQAGRRPLPHLRRRPRPPPGLLRLRQHRPVAARRHPRPRPATERGGGAVGAVGAGRANSITEGKRTRGGPAAGGRPPARARRMVDWCCPATPIDHARGGGRQERAEDYAA